MKMVMVILRRVVEFLLTSIVNDLWEFGSCSLLANFATLDPSLVCFQIIEMIKILVKTYYLMRI